VEPVKDANKDLQAFCMKVCGLSANLKAMPHFYFAKCASS